MRFVVIGNGPAAISAVESIRQYDTESAIAVISAEGDRPYTPCFLGKYVVGTIGFEELALRDHGFYEEFGVELIAGRRAVRMDAEAHIVELDDGQVVPYDRLLIACGAESVVPDIPGIEGPRAVGLRSLEDADQIRSCLDDVREVVVVGSGFVALEAAEALAEAGTHVSVIVRTQQVLRRLFDVQIAEMVERHMAANGVTFLKSCEVAGVERDHYCGRIENVALSDDRRIPCDMLVFAAGMRPSIGIAEKAGIGVAWGILTDSVMRTSDPDVWAAGDVAEPEIAGVRKVNLIHPNAVLTGRVAGLSMVGVDRPISNHFVDMNVITLFGRSFMSIGVLGEGETLTRTGEDGDLLKLNIDDGVVRGVQLVGNVSRGGLYAALLGRRLPEGVGPRLLSPDFNFGDIETWPFAR